ncbi:uncharacterized protein LOC121409538 [Lytechinus variegatus]|uniref:uncharacterized protein LOC121409538 n=1 Tax=Lytechinus variegatus TaxID=7654 RepID=UPI001BB2B9C0|nr:uncharacterized protein LOC121409538 [Lytechinus variegatus]
MAEELKDTIAQSLECPVCLTTFTDPKILSCCHTYCKVCLEKLLECHGDDQMIRCPVCRTDTQVPNQDVSQLPASLALRNLIEDVKNQHQICTNCDSEEKSKAVVYCQDCGKYLCNTCHNTHSQWKDFVNHEIIAICEILSGNMSVRRYRKCRRHIKEDEECFCYNCRRFTCFRCAVMEHKDQGHQVIEAATTYESNHMKTIEEFKSKVEKKQSSFQNYIDLIDEQKKCVDNATKLCTDDINKAYDEAVRQLTEKREILLGEVKEKTKRAEEALEEMKTSARQRINQLTTIAEMVTNRRNAPVDMDTLAVYDTLCEDLQEALNQENPDYEQPNKTCGKAKSSIFERNVGKDELGLGKIVNEILKSITLPTKDSMNVMINTPDGRMAVGCNPGGVNIFSFDGRLQQTVLKDVQIRALGFLSDGRCVVTDTSNTLALYTPEFMKLDVMFETLNHDEGGFSTLTVDSDDLIYVSYRKPEKIQVFSSAGGKAVKEIQCHGYIPSQITSYNDSLFISTGETVHLIDKEGEVKHTLTKPSTYLHAAVSQSNTILVAMVKYDEGLVSIGEYTDELKHIRNLVNEYKIEKPIKRNWYYLQQYRSGEIAFCSPDNLYIMIT